jgi:hypothetical protein
MMLILRLLLWAAALFYLGCYLWLALSRLSYPFELEWMEGGSVDHVCRILAGQPLYGPPHLDFVPFIYTPLYFYVSAALSSLLGIGFLPLRIVSFGSSLASLGIIFLMVKRETGSGFSGLMAAGLMAATYNLTSGWFDVARIDSLFVCFSLLALYVIRFHETWIGDFLAALLLCLAFLTKQTAFILSLPVALYMILIRGRGAIRYLVLWMLMLVGSHFALDAGFRGWYSYYVLKLPLSHGIEIGRALDFWLRDTIQPFPLAFLLGIAWFLLLRTDRGKRKELLFYSLAVVGLIFGSWSARAHSGGWSNVLIPGFAGLSILFGLAICRLQESIKESSSPRAALAANVVLVAAFLQFISLIYPPGEYLPRSTDEAAGRDLIRRMQEIKGEILFLSHGYLPMMAGKQTHAHEMALLDVLRADRGPSGTRLIEEIQGAIRERRFGAIILDSDWLQAELQEAYVPAGPVFADQGVFWTTSGAKTRPRFLYLPRGDEID